jgi:hypothetical protein
MIANPTVGILGTVAETFGRQIYAREMPVTDEEIRVEMFFRSPICHPSSMYRHKMVKLFDLKYNPEFKDTEDWAFWFLCAEKHVEMANLAEILLRYRIEGQSTTPQAVEIRKQQFIKIYKLIFRDICKPSAKELELHWAINSLDFSAIRKSELYKYLRELESKLLSANYPLQFIQKSIDWRKRRIFFKLTDVSVFEGLKFMIKSGLYSGTNFRYLFVRIFGKGKKRQNTDDWN